MGVWEGAGTVSGAKQMQWFNYSPLAPAFSGTVASGTLTSIVCTGAGWTVNEFVDKVVRLQKNGGADHCFAVIISNTADTLNFDDPILLVPDVTCTFSILDTLVVEDIRLPILIAINISSYNCAILLPQVSNVNEREYINPYIETQAGDNKACIMCRTTDRQLGIKYGSLERKGEGVRLFPHTWNSGHFDIVTTQGIKRFAMAYFSVAAPVTTTAYAPVGNALFDRVSRFVTYPRLGNTWIRYTSLLPIDFEVKMTVTIHKSVGGAGELTIALRHRNGTTGVETDLTTRTASTRFGAGEGYEAVSLTVPVTLNRNDELVMIAKRDAGTFEIVVGSAISITEI